MLTRNEAFDMVSKNVSKKNVVYHMLAVEAIMRELAGFFNENEDEWGLIGLLHDIDYEETEAKPEQHGLLAAEKLGGLVPDRLIKAIKSHNSKHTGIPPECQMEKALTACDAMSGLLVACALVMPSRKLVDVRVESVAKKFRDRDFARGAERERIIVCEEIGIPRDKFFEIALNGLKKSAARIEL